MKNRFFLFLIPFFLIFVCCKNPVKGPDYNSEPQSESEFVTENESESQTQNLQYICFSLNQPRMATIDKLYDYGLQYILIVTDKEGNEVLKSEKPEQISEDLYNIFYNTMWEKAKKDLLDFLSSQGKSEEESITQIAEYGGWEAWLTSFNLKSYEEYAAFFNSSDQSYYSNPETFLIFLSPGEYNIEIQGYTLSDTEKKNVVIKGNTDAIIQEGKVNTIAITLKEQNNSQNGGIFYRCQIAKNECKVNEFIIEYISRSVKESDSSASWTCEVLQPEKDYDPGDGFSPDEFDYYIYNIKELINGEYLIKTKIDCNKIKTYMDSDGNEVTDVIPGGYFEKTDSVKVNSGFYTLCSSEYHSELLYINNGQFVKVEIDLNIPPEISNEYGNVIKTACQRNDMNAYLKLNKEYSYAIPNINSYEVTGFTVKTLDDMPIDNTNGLFSCDDSVDGSVTVDDQIYNTKVFSLEFLAPSETGGYKLIAKWEHDL